MADQPMSSDARNQVSDPYAEDSLLKAVLHEVALPAGLASRLQERIRAQYHPPVGTLVTAAVAQPDTGGDWRAPTAEPSVDASEAHADVLSISGTANSDQLSASDRGGDEREGGWLRRTILVAAVAAGICGFAFLARQWTRPAEPTWLAAQCDAILVEIDRDNPADWQTADQPLPAALQRVQSQLARMTVVAERPLAALGSKRRGTVYRLDAGRGSAIYLMRIESLPAVRGLTSRFEILPTPSGGWSLAAMTVGKETFVLAANCTEKQLFTYIRRPALT